MIEWSEDRISDRALRRMSECAALHPDTETGGIGLGRTPFEIVDIIPSGPSAKRTHGSFDLDPDFLNMHLIRARQRGLAWTAVWHSHPEGCPGPSKTDQTAARSLLNDPETGLSGRLLLPIVMRRGRSSFETRFWVAEGRHAELHQVCPIIVSDPTLNEPQQSHPHSPDPPSLEALFGPHRDARVLADVGALEKVGYAVAYRKHSSGRRFVRLNKDTITFVIVIPPEYPLSPPDICVEEGEGARRIPLCDTPSLTAWSSLRDLEDVVREAERSILNAREAEALILRPKPIELVRRALPRVFLSRPNTRNIPWTR